MAVNHEYAAILSTDPKFQVWYEVHSRVLLHEIGTQQGKNELENIVHMYLKSWKGLRRSLVLPRVTWTSHGSNVLNITGQPFAIPTMTFAPDQQTLFQALAGENSAGSTITFPIEYASRGRLNHTDSIDSQIVLLRDPSIPSIIHPHESAQHEFTHAIDPWVDIRPKDRSVLSEIAAIIGSYSDTDARNAGINLFPPYILPYLINEQHGAETSSDDQIADRAVLINSLVYNMTHTIPKLPNDAVTRRVMACRSLDELKRNWPQVFPDYGESGNWTIKPRPRQR